MAITWCENGTVTPGTLALVGQHYRGNCTNCAKGEVRVTDVRARTLYPHIPVKR